MSAAKAENQPPTNDYTAVERLREHTPPGVLTEFAVLAYRISRQYRNRSIRDSLAMAQYVAQLVWQGSAQEVDGGGGGGMAVGGGANGTPAAMDGVEDVEDAEISPAGPVIDERAFRASVAFRSAMTILEYGLIKSDPLAGRDPPEADEIADESVKIADALAKRLWPAE